MKADVSRVTFRAKQHYVRVVQQQGRPLLDADWNEQAAIFDHRLRTLAGDLVGSNTAPTGAPALQAGFEINALDNDAESFSIGHGRYYVDGLCCECDADTSFAHQPLRHAAAIDRNGISLVYLDAWESVVTPLDDPALLEPALAGVQTTLRSRVAWQVRTHRLSDKHDAKAPNLEDLKAESDEFLATMRAQPRGMLRVRLGNADIDTGRRQARGQHAPRFRGPENLLYRVEIHRGGPAGDATFKWSRDNGAVLLPLTSLEGDIATIAPLARGEAAARSSSWFEISDAASRALSRTEPMVRLAEARGGAGRYELKPGSPLDFAFEGGARGDVALRCWDQRAAAKSGGGADGIDIVEGAKEAHWIDLEDGIEIQFVADDKHPARYRAGDYWLIPARTANDGTILRSHEAMPPDGVSHYYAPLALFVPQKPEVIADYRQTFQPLAALQDQVTSLSEALDELVRRVKKLEGG